MYYFNDSKATTCFGPQAKSFVPLSVLMKGRLCSANREMNLFSAASLPASLWTSQADCGGVMYNIACNLAWFASMPLWDTR
jgi:hypothetical protein